FNVLNGVPATGNKFLQRDILKGKWNFKGFVVSDWGSGFEMIDHGYAKDLKHAAELAANAGSDMDMESYSYVRHLKQLVDEGLFDNPYKYCDSKREKELIYHADNIAASLDMAKKSIVLLKNENNLLPLAKTQKKIAVIGALANDKNSPLGSWRIGSDDNTAISVIEGLKNIGANITYAKGADLITAPTSFPEEVKINETDKSEFAAAIKLAKKSDVVIMVFGEHGFQSGEGRSRSKLDLPGVQQQLLEAIYK
ncbi:unnamed protein product, partial [Rotaria sp. Silwood1]